jgi:hypothetical protein
LKNVTLTLAVPKKLKEELNELKEINWSEETRQFLEKRVKRLMLLKKLDEATQNSTLTEEDVIEIGRKINEGIARREGVIN